MQRPLLSGFTQSASSPRLSDKEGNPRYADPEVLFRETATTLAQFAEIPTSLLKKRSQLQVASPSVMLT